MTDKKDLTDNNMTGMPKPSFDINKNPFRDGDSLVDAVRAVLSGQPVTQEQKAELEKENPAGLQDKRTQTEDASNDKSDDGEGLDKVDTKAVKKKFDNRKDKDIDNDGDTDDSDEYLHKKRKAITKDVEKDDAQEGNAFSKALENAKKNGDKTFVVAGKKYNCEDVQEVAMGFIKNKQFPGKEIAKKMKAMGRPMSGQADKVAKLKKVTWRELDMMLPDMIAGKDIAALFTKEDVQEGFKVGDKVKKSGYPGVITKVHSGKLKGMVDVKLKRGTVTVDAKSSVTKEDASNDKSDDGEGLDKVDPKAVKKKFDDRKDKDIDNDGDTDDSDEFLHKRRKAISKSIAKEMKEKAKDTVLAVNPKDPKAKRGGGVQKVKKKDWPALQKKGWILAEQATVYIDPESKYIEVDFGPAGDLDDILVEGMMYEKSMGKLKPVKNFRDDEVRSWGMNDFREYLASIVDVAKAHVYFHSGDIKFEYPEKIKEDERKYKYVTKVIAKKAEELVKAIQKTPK